MLTSKTKSVGKDFWRDGIHLKQATEITTATTINYRLASRSQGLRNSWSRSWIHLLATHLWPNSTGQPAWPVRMSGRPFRCKLNQKRQSFFDGNTVRPISIKAVAPPAAGCDIWNTYQGVEKKGKLRATRNLVTLMWTIQLRTDFQKFIPIKTVLPINGFWVQNIQLLIFSFEYWILQTSCVMPQTI